MHILFSEFTPMFKDIWITKAYSGKAKLWKVFWFGYVATLLPTTILTNIAKEISLINPSSFFVGIAFLAVLLLNVWLAVSMWRCSANSSHTAYELLGKIWSVAQGFFALLAIQLAFGS